MADITLTDLALRMRALAYDRFTGTGLALSVASLSIDLGAPRWDIEDALAGLASVRQVVLPAGGEVLMANPFSAVPIPFKVQTAEFSYWGSMNANSRLPQRMPLRIV